MSKEIVIWGAIILSFIHVFYEVFRETNELRREIPSGPSCIKLKNEKCSIFIWYKLFFKKYPFCRREKCPSFVYSENGKTLKKLSVLSVLEIIIKQTPALAALLLLFLQIIE